MHNEPSPSRPMDRRQHLARAAITVLGTTGARGLTHRGVDTEAGLPAGSTSNLFRTREDLLVGALDELIAQDFVHPLEPGGEAVPSPEAAVEAVLALITAWTAPGARALLQARYELFLEATRRPQFAARFLERRERIVATAERLIGEEDRQLRRLRALALVQWIDGLLMDALLDPSLVDDAAALARAVGEHLTRDRGPTPGR